MFNLKSLYDNWVESREKKNKWSSRKVNLTFHAHMRFKSDTKDVKPKAPTSKQKIKNIFLESDKVNQDRMDNSFYANPYGIFVEKRGVIVTFIGVKRMTDEKYTGMFHKYQKEIA